MKKEIFIGWSGYTSKIAAEKLRTWIPEVVQNAKPWVSTEDINVGERWFQDVSGKLKEMNFGIF